jgi:cation diffusion facilitator CzcD-associated flavoprotein CzcO
MHNYVIIGGGIVGLATAIAVGKKCPKARILVLEKGQDVADLTLLDRLHRRGLDHRLAVTRLAPEQVQEIEPHVRCHLNTQPAPVRAVVWPGQIKLVRQPTPRS